MFEVGQSCIVKPEGGSYDELQKSIKNPVYIYYFDILF